MNKISVEGRLIADPMSLDTVDNVITTFSILYNETERFDCVVHGNLAKKAANDLKANTIVEINGHLSSRPYKDKDGYDRRQTDITVDSYIVK